MLTVAAGRDLSSAGDIAAVLDWRLTALTPPDSGPLPWLPGIPSALNADPGWGSTWQSEPNWSLTSPAKSKTTPAKVPSRQSGHLREATPAPPSSVKSQCGGPPTASIPKTRDQPEEEANSKRSRPSGNNASTGISPVPPTNQAMQRPTSERRNGPPLAGSARTKDPTGVRADRPHPAVDPVEPLRRGCSSADTVMAHPDDAR
jgi:hypothetical protein